MNLSSVRSGFIAGFWWRGKDMKNQDVGGISFLEFGSFLFPRNVRAGTIRVTKCWSTGYRK